MLVYFKNTQRITLEIDAKPEETIKSLQQESDNLEAWRK